LCGKSFVTDELAVKRDVDEMMMKYSMIGKKIPDTAEGVNDAFMEDKKIFSEVCNVKALKAVLLKPIHPKFVDLVQERLVSLARKGHIKNVTYADC